MKTLPAKVVKDPEAQQNFEVLGSLLPTLLSSVKKDVAVDFGTGAVTWDGTNNLVDVTVNHELGVIPVIVLWSSTGTHWLNGRVIGQTATTATIEVANTGPAPAAGHSDDIFWLAVA